MDAKEMLKQHIDNLFAGTLPSRAVYDLKEELYANSIERFDDLTAQGMEPGQAVQSVIASIGNVDELIDALPQEEKPEEKQQRYNKSALTISISVGLYLVAIVPLLIGSISGKVYVGIVSALVICIVPTCLLVYNAVTRHGYKRKDNTIVEEFKQWSADKNKRRAIYAAVTVLLWSVLVLVYLAVSFLTGAWNITWMIFLVGICLQAAISLGFLLKGMSP